MLPNVFWAYKTTPRKSIGETLFPVTFGIEVVILMEVGLSSMRIAGFSPNTNDMAMTEQYVYMVTKRSYLRSTIC